MSSQHQHITLFEHDRLCTHRGQQRISASQLEDLQKFYGENGVPYFTLIHEGVKFNHYVGVLQLGNLTIEVLPKADKQEEDGTVRWRKVLIGMLRSVGVFEIKAPTNSSLTLKANSILELYFSLFIQELNYLLRRGLVKKYRKTSNNQKAWKGKLEFSRHLQQNLVHQERFFVRHTVYDTAHQLHGVLYKTLKLLHRINTHASLSSQIGALLLNFPEMPDLKVSEQTFERLTIDRKTEPYRKAIEIARLLLLNYHPDLSQGRHDVLALMFDMNYLWERFVYLSLKKHLLPGHTITAQTNKAFWRSDSGQTSRMKPDIILNKGKADCIVLDTKWKNLYGKPPSPEDLRQMYVYAQYYQAKQVALIYPGNTNEPMGGKYYEVESGRPGQRECSLISLSCQADIPAWQNEIGSKVESWLVNKEPQ